MDDSYYSDDYDPEEDELFSEDVDDFEEELEEFVSLTDEEDSEDIG